MIQQVRQRPPRPMGNTVHSSGRCQKQQRRKLIKSSDQLRLWQQFNDYCNTVKGEEQFHAKSLYERTLFIEPSPNNKYRVRGTLHSHGRSKSQQQQDKLAIRKFERFLLFQRLKAFCDDEEGDDQVKAKSLRDRTLYVEPSHTHAIETKIDGKFKGRGRSARQKAEDKKVIARFRRWMQEQEPHKKQEHDEQGAREPGNDGQKATGALESNEEELELTNWEKEKIVKLQKDERWQLVTRGVNEINQPKSPPFKIPTNNEFSLLSDFPRLSRSRPR